jgi:hypothetical protein
VPSGEIGAGYDVLRAGTGLRRPAATTIVFQQRGGMSKSPGIMSDG